MLKGRDVRGSFVVREGSWVVVWKWRRDYYYV